MKTRKYTTKKMRMRKFIIKGILITFGAVFIFNLVWMAGVSTYNFLFKWDFASAEVTTVSIPKKAISKPEMKIEAYEIVKEYYATTTAYNAGVEAQTDSSPCTTANGENICNALARGLKRCAANNLKFGTRLLVEGYGECIVTDRMNKRFQNGEIDVAFELDQRDIALKFGAKKRLIKILK
jgi:3D (Asp-Asp-Asp) domain-containing protein